MSDVWQSLTQIFIKGKKESKSSHIRRVAKTECDGQGLKKFKVAVSDV